MDEELIPFEDGTLIPDLSQPPASLAALGSGEALTVDPETVRQAMGKDEKAFSTLFRQTYPYAFTLVCSRLAREQDRMDALQETYTQVWAGLPRLRDPSAFLGWLKSIALACASHIYNGGARETLSPDPTAWSEYLTDAPEEPSRETLLDIRGVLNTLPEEEARLLVLVYYDGMKLSEIAKMQGIPASTVRSRFAKAKKDMQNALKERGIDRAAYSRSGFISTLATGMREAVGTELLSAAVAQQILDSVLVKDKSPAGHVAEQLLLGRRNKAVLRATTVVLVMVAALAVVISSLVAWAILGRNRLPAAPLPAQTGETSSTASITGEQSVSPSETETAFSGQTETAEVTDPVPTDPATTDPTDHSPVILPPESGQTPGSETDPFFAQTTDPSVTDPGLPPVTLQTGPASTSADLTRTGVTAEATMPATNPMEPTTKPTVPTTKPTAPTTKPTTPTTKPTAPTTKPTTPTTKPTTPTTKPTTPPTTAPTEPDGFVPDYRPGKANLVGNVPDNLVNHDKGIAGQDNWIYYFLPGTLILRKQNLNTGEDVDLIRSDKFPHNISVVGDWIYFNGANSTVRRLRTDGTGYETLLPGVFPSWMAVRGDELYYTENDVLYRHDLPTGKTTKLDSNVWKVSLGEGHLYYVYHGWKSVLFQRSGSGWSKVEEGATLLGVWGNRALCKRADGTLAVHTAGSGWRTLGDGSSFPNESISHFWYWYAPAGDGVFAFLNEGVLTVTDLSDFTSTAMRPSQNMKVYYAYFFKDRVYWSETFDMFSRALDGSDQPVMVKK